MNLRRILSLLLSGALALALLPAAAFPTLALAQSASSTQATGETQAASTHATFATLEAIPAADGVDETDEGLLYAEGEVLVTFKESTSEQQQDAAIEQALTVADTAPGDARDVTSDTKLVETVGDASVAQAVTELEANPAVEAVQPNYRYVLVDKSIAETTAADEAATTGKGESFEDAETNATATAVATAEAASAAEATPLATVNDPSASLEWALSSARFTQAWDVAKCNNQVAVAVLDTGIDTDHEDLKGNIVAATSSVSSWHDTTNHASPEDVNGHGTHVAGIIAARANNAVGVAGSSYNASIVSVRVFATSNGAYTDDITRGIDYAIEKAGTYNIKAINMSLGYPGEPTTDEQLTNAIDDAYDAGILCVVAAGNATTITETTGGGTRSVTYTPPYECFPANYEKCVTVGNLQEDSTRNWSSNYNPQGSTWLDLCAPGTKIYSTIVAGYYYKTGTSMAAPQVAAAVALCYAVCPTATPQVVEATLEGSATDLGAVGYDNEYGWGALDAFAAVTAMQQQAKSMYTYSGAERYETAGLILDAELQHAATAYPSTPYTGIIVACGDGERFPDALCAAGLAGILNYPVVLVNGESEALNNACRASLAAVASSSTSGKLDIIVVGGTPAVSLGIEHELQAYDADGAITRCAGETRYETCLEIYRYGETHGGWNKGCAVVATGANFPDALGMAGYCAANRAPIFLVSPTSAQLSTGVSDELRDGFGSAVVLGSSDAVSDALYAQVEAAFGSSSAVERVYGADRYATNRACIAWQLERGMTFDHAGFAVGSRFPDALGSGFLLSLTGSVLCLTDPTYAANPELYFLLGEHASEVSAIHVFGSEDAVDAPTRTAITTALGGIWTTR